MRNPQNIGELLELPIDLMGLIFYKKSARNVRDSAADKIVAASKGKVNRVGVFVNEGIDIVIQKVAKFKLEYVQLHGNESPDYCYDLLAKSAQTFGCEDELKIIKVFSIDEHFDFFFTKEYVAYCQYFLFDTKGEKAGGNGYPFNWTVLKKYKENVPFLLSGGLDEFSVERIKSLNLPQLVGVDVNSKFEVSPALKDVKMIKRFCRQLKKEVQV